MSSRNAFPFHRNLAWVPLGRLAEFLSELTPSELERCATMTPANVFADIKVRLYPSKAAREDAIRVSERRRYLGYPYWRAAITK